MNGITNYLKESYDELVNRVSWPTFADLQHSTTVVLVASVIIAVLIYVMDTASNALLSFIY
jgi:preprotein translocase subunit SecE